MFLQEEGTKNSCCYNQEDTGPEPRSGGFARIGVAARKLRASSRQRESHPKPLTEPYVKVSSHTALLIRSNCFALYFRFRFLLLAVGFTPQAQCANKSGVPELLSRNQQESEDEDMGSHSELELQSLGSDGIGGYSERNQPRHSGVDKLLWAA